MRQVEQACRINRCCAEILYLALPTITAYFNAGETASWIATAFLLTSCAFQPRTYSPEIPSHANSSPVYGRFSDIWGRKVMLLSALAIFLVFNLACALSQTLIQLIIFRALAGIGKTLFLLSLEYAFKHRMSSGAAGTVTLSLIIIGDVVSLERRGSMSPSTQTYVMKLNIPP